ncbi:MAG: FGGY-family carbohydrate kinase [Gallionella sp.]
MNYYLGLDFGTSGARSSVIDDDHVVVWKQQVSYADAASQTPQDWRSALHQLLRGLPGSIASHLSDIAIDGTSATVLLCDEHLTPLHQALPYRDDRAQQQAGQLRNIAPDNHPVCSATSGLAKFLWMTQHLDCAHATHFLHQTDWLTALISGKPGISDYHNALKTGYDVETLQWPEWVLALPHAHLLPTVQPPGAAIGRVISDIASHFGINPDCTVRTGTTDSIAAYIASGTPQIGSGVTSLGSTLVLKQLSRDRIESAELGIYSHRYGDLWLVGGASNAGAGVLRHFFSNAQLATLSSAIDPGKDSPLNYYPLTQTGERFPVNDPQLAPRITPRPDSDVEFLHGLLQGLARIEMQGYTTLAALGAAPVLRIFTNGGGAINEVWRQIRERILGVPVSVAKHSEAAYGVAKLCTADFRFPSR